MPALRPREQGVLRAFAQALLPPGGPLPGAEVEGGVAVIGVLDGVAGRASPRTRLALRLGLNALEWSTFPRRFSKLPLEARTTHLRKLGARRSGLWRELFSSLKSLVSLAYANHADVRRSVGVRVGCESAGVDAPNSGVAALCAEDMQVPTGSESCDVVIVGSGAGGAAVARVVAEAGLSVIVLEEGAYYDAASYSTDTFDATATLYRDGGSTVCEGQPTIPLPIGRCVGGTTVINSGTCLRTPPDVLASWRDELGIEWATDLDREFEQLERDLNVKPVDPARAGRNAELCRAGAEALGASNGPITRNAGDVVCCGTCPTGCAIDAKQAMHVSELPRAVAAGARIRAGARVERILFDGHRAVGVRAATDRGSYEVRSRAVVLAAGAVGTPQLLISQGVSDLSGQIGRNLRIHPACWVGGIFDEEVRGWDGVMQSWYVDEWRDRGLFMEATFTPLMFGVHWMPGVGEDFKRRIEDYGNLAIVGVHLSDHGSRGRVAVGRSGHAQISYRLDPADAREIQFGIARAAEMQLAAGATEVHPQIAGVGPISSRRELRAIEDAQVRPAQLRLDAFHPMGTARMGADRATSVVAPSGESHELEGLYIADASILPSSLGVNPMITIMACARRIAAGLVERLG
ncbi:MAG: GMC family oxidoreductase [Solirubrobacterales bacterium]